MPVIVCFSYGLDPDGSFGNVNEIRCEKAARLYQRLTKCRRGRARIVATAGIIPNFPHQKEPLGIMQRRSLEKVGVSYLHIFPSEGGILFSKKNVMSTTEEIRAAIDIARSKLLVGPFYAVSHWYHLPRILWFGWWRGRCFRPAPVFRSTPWKSVAAEMLKWPVAIIDPFGSAWGRRAAQWAREHHIW